MSLLSSPAVIGISDVYSTLDPTSDSSSLPRWVALENGVATAKEYALLWVSVPSDFGVFQCYLRFSIRADRGACILGKDWFNIFREYVIAQESHTHEETVQGGASSTAADSMNGLPDSSRPAIATDVTHDDGGSPVIEPLREILRRFVRLYLEIDCTLYSYSHGCVKAIMHDHGLFLDNNTSLHARHMLLVHLLNGMCSFSGARACMPLHGYEMTTIQEELGLLILERIQMKKIDELCIRDICAALALRTSRDVLLDEVVIHFRERPCRAPLLLEVNELLPQLWKFTRANFINFCSYHGLYPAETNEQMRCALLHHLITGCCVKGSASGRQGCGVWQNSLPKTFDDAHARTSVLSVIYAKRTASARMLRNVLMLLGVPHTPQNSYDDLYQLLKTYIFSLRRGPSVLQTVLEQMAMYSRPQDIAQAHAAWPECASNEMRLQIQASFEQAIDVVRSPSAVCASCDIPVPQTQTISVSATEIDLDTLRVPPDWSDLDLNRDTGCDFLLAPAGVSETATGTDLCLCLPCHNALSKCLLPKMSMANHLYVGQVPQELKGLTVVEESMIALTRLKCMILQLKEDNLRAPRLTSQRAYTGHTIYYHQNIQEFATVLPPPVDDIVRFVCVLFVGSHKPSLQYLQAHARPLAVRASVVRRALIWLKTHNRLYRDITIDHQVLDHIENCGGLPYTVEHIESAAVHDDTVSGYTQMDGSSSASADDDGSTIFHNLMITDLEGSPSPSEMRAAALHHLQQGKPFIQLGHASTPEQDYNNPNLFPSMFPTLYPYGVGGFEDPDRSPPVGFQVHMKHLLALSDRRFQTHPSFMFTAFNILQRREILRRTQMKMRRSDYTQKANMYAQITPEAIRHVSEMSGAGNNSTDSGSPERAVQRLMQDVQLVNSTVLGSNAARKVMREEIRSMITSLGPPSLFITINPADIYNPLVRVLAGDEIDLDSLLPEPGPHTAFFSQSRIIAENPIVAAQFFDLYMNSFFSTILGYRHGRDKVKGLFGYTKGFYGCAESQGRGSLHCHCVIWLEGGLDPNEIKRRLMSRQDLRFEHRLIRFLETNILSSIPHDPGLVEGVASSVRHPCSVRPVLRLDTESERDFLTRRAKDLYNLVSACQRHSHSATCYKYCKNTDERKCRFGLDRDNYVPFTTIDYETGELCFQCLDGLVNHFNETIIELVRCNMDIKFIGSGHSAKAILYYITDYVTKSQLKMHVIYNALEIAVRKLQAPVVLVNDAASPEKPLIDHARSMLRKAANAIVSMQELSAQQVALYAIRGADNYTSHSFRSLYWKYIEHYFEHTSPLHLPSAAAGEPPDVLSPDGRQHDSTIFDSDDENEEMHDPDDVFEDATIAISRTNGLVMRGSQLADYIYRAPELDCLSMWDFVAHCEKVRIPKQRRRNSTENPPSSPDALDVLDVAAEDAQPPDIDDARTMDVSEETSAQTSFAIPYDAISATTHARKLLRFKRHHAESDTHGIKVADYLHSSIPVLVGPSIPRRDNIDAHTQERYARLMLIFFKPWRHPRDFDASSLSWLERLHVWLSSDNASFRHCNIIKNIELLNDCRDSRDRDYENRHRSHSSTFKPVAPDCITRISDLTVDSDPQNDDHAEHCEDGHVNNIDTHASKLLQDRTQLVDRVIKKGIVAGLFTLNYSLSDLDIHDNAVIRSTSTTKEREQTWLTEYAARKLKWKNDTIARLAELSNHSSNDTVTAIMNIGPLTPDEPSVIPGVASLPVSSSSSITHMNRVADMWTLDADQRRAFFIVAQHACNAGNSQLKMFLAGPAGSGKSQVIKALCQFFDDRNESHRLRLAAFMGIAAHNIGGVTLHAALNMNPRTNSCSSLGKAAHELRSLWLGVDFLFVDEISMIGCDFLQRINDALIHATGRALPFGGINVIVSGDMEQLPPIGETSLVTQFTPYQIRNALSPASQRKLAGRALWLSIQTVIMLSGNNRQAGAHNARFRELLGRLRHGVCNDADYDLLSSRIMSRCMTRHTLNDFLNAPVIVCENAMKDALNEQFSRRFAEATGQDLNWYLADDYVAGQRVLPSSAHGKLLSALHTGCTQNRLHRLPLVIGLPVMITHNISLESGVVNGVIGRVASICYRLVDDNLRVLTSCTVHIAQNNQPHMTDLDQGFYPILPDSVYFKYETKEFSVSVKRRQCPLIPAFAMTAHKSQGQSLRQVIVDLDSCHGTEAPYVMISRATSLDGLLIYRAFDKKRIQCNSSEHNRAEARRIRANHLLTCSNFTADGLPIVADSSSAAPSPVPSDLSGSSGSAQLGNNRRRRAAVLDNGRPVKRLRLTVPVPSDSRASRSQPSSSRN